VLTNVKYIGIELNVHSNLKDVDIIDYFTSSRPVQKFLYNTVISFIRHYHHLKFFF